MTNLSGIRIDRFSDDHSLKAPGAILLISCYELGRQPLGIAWAAGFLKRAGYQADTLDLSVEPLDERKIRRARLVGISVPMHTALRLGVRAAERVRQINPSSHLCFVGLYASLNARRLLLRSADSVIGGEYEAALVRLAAALDKDAVASPIEGVSWRGGLSRPVLARLPFVEPDRASLPGLERYAKLEFRGVNRLAGAVEASRGCKHHCRHCPIPPVYNGRFFVIPREVVLEDVQALVRAGAEHITFGDPDFLNGPGHAMAVARSMHAAFPALTFDVTVKIEHLIQHRMLVRELAALGCLFVVSAVESLSDAVLGYLAKGHTRADVFDALTIVQQAGIALRPSWVAFTPWTTLEDYLEMLEFIEREDLVDHVDPVQFSIRLLVPPGSRLLQEPDIRPFLRGIDEADVSYHWEHPDPRMDALQHAVSRQVEISAARNEDAAVTFARIKTLALRAGGAVAPHVAIPRFGRERPPRLTETWFCCSEPTSGQLKTLAAGVNTEETLHG